MSWLPCKRSKTLTNPSVLTKPTGGILVPGYDYDMKIVGSVLGSIIAFVIPFGLTYSHIVWYQSEYLALEIRAAGSAISTTACWVANLVISVAYLSQLNTLGAPGTYGLYLGFVTAGYIFIVFCYPESKGLSLEETTDIFSDGFGVKKAHLMLKQKQEIAQRLREEGQV